MTRETIKRCPRCNSPRQTYNLSKDGVCVECKSCGFKGQRANTSWYADKLWNQIERKNDGLDKG